VDAPVIPQLDPRTVQAALASGAVLVDVREAEELEEAAIPGATWIPLSELNERWREIPADRDVVVMCGSGRRSQAVAEALANAGFQRVSNLGGGIIAWANAGLPVQPR